MATNVEPILPATEQRDIEILEAEGNIIHDSIKDLSNFNLEKILHSNSNRKSVCLQGTFEGASGVGIVLLEKTAFEEDILRKKDNFFNDTSTLKKIFQNDIYGNYELYPKVELNACFYKMIENDSNQSDSLCTPQEILDDANMATSNLLPEKSKKIYDMQYKKFQDWCNGSKVKNITETILLTYFHKESEVFKSSTLWSHYSMLKSTIMINNNVDISRFPKLIAYLKRKSDGYQAKESRIFTREDFNKFILTAPDNKFLLMKVILTIGIAGACLREELVKMSLDHMQDLGSILIIKIPDAKTKVERSFTVTETTSLNAITLYRKYANLRPPFCSHRRFFLRYKAGKCAIQPIGINTIGKIPSMIASFLKLINPTDYTAHSFRKTSATFLADAQADIITIKRHFGSRSMTVVEGLIENSIEDNIDIKKEVLEEKPITPLEGYQEIYPGCIVNSKILQEIPQLSKESIQEVSEININNSIKTSIIYPATEKHIEKFSTHSAYIIDETPEIYSIVLKHITEEQFNLQWLYNVLEHKSETERIVFEDADKVNGFILLPDLKWNGVTLETLYLLAIVQERNLKSLRDLSAEHLPLLKNIQQNGIKAIEEKYGLPASKLRIYLHYQPSFYHLHVHFTYLQYDAPGINAERSHLLSNVISNIELKSDYYQKVTLPYVVHENHSLFKKLEAEGLLKKSNVSKE